MKHIYSYITINLSKLYVPQKYIHKNEIKGIMNNHFQGNENKLHSTEFNKSHAILLKITKYR